MLWKPNCSGQKSSFSFLKGIDYLLGQNKAYCFSSCSASLEVYLCRLFDRVTELENEKNFCCPGQFSFFLSQASDDFLSGRTDGRKTRLFHGYFGRQRAAPRPVDEGLASEATILKVKKEGNPGKEKRSNYEEEDALGRKSKGKQAEKIPSSFFWLHVVSPVWRICVTVNKILRLWWLW